MPVTALPYQARLELLDALGVDDPAVGAAIATDCDGVPYFLHLAREAGSSASAYARIEERFLHHVAPEMVKILELLSVARFFDRDIFRQVARHYELRADAQSWETLIAYSFIADAGPDTLQMHQLMARAIQARLSPGVLTELHELLRDIWRDRALQSPSVTAWREAAFHAASAQPSDIPGLLTYADQLASAGKPGLDSMRTDLTGLDQSGRYGKLISLLAAEASLLVGDASNAHTALGDVAVALPAEAGRDRRTYRTRRRERRTDSRQHRRGLAPVRRDLARLRRSGPVRCRTLARRSRHGAGTLHRRHRHRRRGRAVKPSRPDRAAR